MPTNKKYSRNRINASQLIVTFDTAPDKVAAALVTAALVMSLIGAFDMGSEANSTTHPKNCFIFTLEKVVN